MADAEGVVFALLALGRWGHAVLVLDGVDRVGAAGEALVRVGMVTGVPDDAVVGAVVHRVQAAGPFDPAVAADETPARVSDRFGRVGAASVGEGGSRGFAGLSQGRRGF